MDELKKIIRDEVLRELNMGVRDIEFDRYKNEDGRPILRVDLWLKRTDRKIKDDVFVRLVPLVADVIVDSGVDAFPLIMPHLARGQEMKSKLLPS